ncbi:MAG: DUF2202 domain-containing protein [Spirochaetales bacterium]|nr:DUF2202 domain-containing protein [Spirochaetales bacterium]
MKKTAILLICSLSFSAWALEGFGSAGASRDKDLTEEDMLIYAIQDEYAARQEYYTILEEYGQVSPFPNIVKAEETHIGLLIPLFEKYGYALPEDSSGEHVVLPKDLKSSFEVGVEAEILNIAMYEQFLSENLPADIRDVFEKLKRASESHLRAFENGLKRY